MSFADGSLCGVMGGRQGRPPSQRISPQIRPANKRIHRVMPTHAPSIIGHPKPPQQFIIALISFLFSSSSHISKRRDALAFLTLHTITYGTGRAIHSSCAEEKQRDAPSLTQEQAPG